MDVVDKIKQPQDLEQICEYNLLVDYSSYKFLSLHPKYLEAAQWESVSKSTAKQS